METGWGTYYPSQHLRIELRRRRRGGGGEGGEGLDWKAWLGVYIISPLRLSSTSFSFPLDALHCCCLEIIKRKCFVLGKRCPFIVYPHSNWVPKTFGGVGLLFEGGRNGLTEG